MPNENGTFTPEEVESLKVQLQGEISTRDQQLAEKDQAVADLQERINSQEQEISTLQSSQASQEEAHRQALEQARADLEATKTEREALSAGLSAAVGKYRALVLSTNPGIPVALIQGEDIEALEASLEKARGVVDQVKDSLQAQAQAAPVPAGAPARTGPETEALSSTEKIKFALRGR